ncbi:unnamed protein product, partial [Polarella glacialis]
AAVCGRLAALGCSGGSNNSNNSNNNSNNNKNSNNSSSNNNNTYSRCDLHAAAVELEPRSSRSRNNLGLALAPGPELRLRDGSCWSREALFARALEFNPRNESAAANLATELARQPLLLRRGQQFSRQARGFGQVGCMKGTSIGRGSQHHLRIHGLGLRDWQHYQFHRKRSGGFGPDLTQPQQQRQQHDYCTQALELHEQACQLRPLSTRRRLRLAAMFGSGLPDAAVGQQSPDIEDDTSPLAHDRLPDPSRLRWREELQRALELDPNSADACHQLGVALAQSGSFLRLADGTDWSAEELLVRALQFQPSAADIYDDLRLLRG